jgi:hypothetical protein
VTETQAWWIIAEVGVVALITLLTFLLARRP